MDSPLKQRLIGAAVLAALAIIFLPMLLKGPDVKEPDAAEVPLSMPATPAGDFETRELPLTTPEESAPPGGVLGMPKGAAATEAVAENAVPSATPEEASPPAANPQAPSASAPAAVASAASAGAATKPALPPVAPAAVPSTPAEAARVGAGAIVVNVGSFANLASANALAAKLRAAGLPVIAEKVQISSGPATRLRLGPYGSRAAAESARLKADAISGSSAKVIVLDAPAPAPAAPAPAVAKPAAAPTTAPAAKPVVAAPAPALPKPAAAVSGFAVQLSAPSVEADANALRDRARAAGFSSFVQKVQTEGGARYRVRVGPVADRSAAETLRDAVNGKLGTAGIVVANP